MIIGQVLGADRVMSMFESLPGKSRDRIGERVRLLAIMLMNTVKGDYLTGQVLHVRSGHLRSSITSKTVTSGMQYTGVVGTNLVYAAIQEFGGQTKPHEILPVHAKALLFQAGGFVGPMQMMTNRSTGRYAKSARGKITAALAEGSMQFARGVHHPGSKMPERSFLRAALTSKTAEIQAQLRAAIEEAVK